VFVDREIEVGIAIVVDVREHAGEGLKRTGVDQQVADVREQSLAEVFVQRIRLQARVRDEDVEVAVRIVVRPARGGAVARVVQSGDRADVDERLTAVVAQQDVRAAAHDVQIGVPVVVEVDECRARARRDRSDVRGQRRQRERAVPIVDKDRPGTLAAGCVQIEPAIRVDVAPRQPGPEMSQHHLMRRMQVEALGDVFERGTGIRRNPGAVAEVRRGLVSLGRRTLAIGVRVPARGGSCGVGLGWFAAGPHVAVRARVGQARRRGGLVVEPRIARCVRAGGGPEHRDESDAA